VCTNIDLDNDDDSVDKSYLKNDNVNKSEFENVSVNKVDSDEINENDEYFDVLQLKNNILPRGLVPLEGLFDFNNVAKKANIEPTGREVEECNIGTE